jgi:hypothetical protein
MMLRSREEIDPKIIITTLVAVIVIDVFICVAILILDGVNNAMATTNLILGLLKWPR